MFAVEPGSRDFRKAVENTSGFEKGFMIAGFILVLSIAALVQWVVAYGRSFILSAADVEISKKTREVVGLADGSVSPCEFDHLLALVRMAPNQINDAREIRTVSAYYRITSAASQIAALFSPSAKCVFDRELARCSHFAAVALDRRLSPVTAA